MTKNLSREAPQPLEEIVSLDAAKILNPQNLAQFDELEPDAPVLLMLAAGKGTRFGSEPKCAQLVCGVPLARRSIEAFRSVSAAPVVCVVGYRHEDVALALGGENLLVKTDNPAGGTAFAAFEAFCVASLLEKNPLLIITMGDRIVPAEIFRRLLETHLAAGEADLTFLTAHYEPPKNSGKGRVVRDETGRVLRIVEERDITVQGDEAQRATLQNLTEGNCPLFLLRARTLHENLRHLTNTNAQGQFYLTDIVENISQSDGEIRTVKVTSTDESYDLLCADVTSPPDLARLEAIFAAQNGISEIENAARAIVANRPKAQIAAIARQLEALNAEISQEKLNFADENPVSVGISGGRLRIAFMHPDMARFFGPAWQMPIGAGSENGDEQIVILAQTSDDERLHLHPLDPKFRENVSAVSTQNAAMLPSADVDDLHKYEEFGTRLSEDLLLSLGYLSDAELEQMRRNGLLLPPASSWISNNMRRPFPLVANAIASLRTLREGISGEKVQKMLGKEHFRGLRLVSTGSVPQGGFSSSSAVTVATQNALNSLYNLEISPDTLIRLACQAEYGTGVRAGPLDQATIQKGRAGQGTLISSNPRDNFRTLGTFSVPTERLRIVFPFSVERDREAWRWSWDVYGESVSGTVLTAGEMRKMTGKAAEMAAILTRLPLETSFFQPIEEELLANGELSDEKRAWICRILRQLPLRATQAELKARLAENRDWYAEQLGDARRADADIEALFLGWRDPLLRRTVAGETIEEIGVPLRAIVAYLFGEVAKNFQLIHHPDAWIEWISRSQRGDCCVDIDLANLPSRREMESELVWERAFAGPARLDLWLQRCGATFFDYNRGLDDATLSSEPPPQIHSFAGGNFFRGLALIDLAEAMSKRAFGSHAVAVRVNAAGQGDYFQVHIDTRHASVEEVKRFLHTAFYARFGLSPQTPFVEPHPGGGAVGIRLSRFDSLPRMIEKLKAEAD